MTNLSRGVGGRPRRHRVLRTPLLLLAALAIVLAGGGALLLNVGDDTPYADAAWKTVEPGGDCHCADGSEFTFWDRRTDPTKVVLFLNGGGVCWDAASCAFTSDGTPGESELYDWNLQSDGPGNNFEEDGIFDFSNDDNPFADYSFLYVASCTGDAHLGNVSQKYSDTLTVEHNGHVNATAALDHLAKTYPDATQVVVIGKTAGSIAAPIYGGLVADRLPNAQVTVFGGQSGAWPDNPDFNTDVLDAAWGAYDTMPDWAVQGLTARQWGVPRFWTQAGQHNPDLVLSRFDYAYDPHAAVEITEWEHGDSPSVAPVPGFDELAVIDANEKAIEAAGANLHSYTAPGDGHGLFEFEGFYQMKVNGTRLVDWLDTLLTDDPPDDVHCTKCDP
ncbi:pectin acetylesterase-family hydrolase [Streptomyces sp. NBC_01304]|uniref:pectin acetylesterase-family hydrolase n=1 Tax=Streptomyces sp. NBC_01304 TaxID=2903818 RepID=UPI002E163527|nr:pectin acetylesterase-family hydrolase [Streptomyces sp. NBC_01304]